MLPRNSFLNLTPVGTGSVLRCPISYYPFDFTLVYLTVDRPHAVVFEACQNSCQGRKYNFCKPPVLVILNLNCNLKMDVRLIL